MWKCEMLKIIKKSWKEITNLMKKMNVEKCNSFKISIEKLSKNWEYES